MESLIKKRGQLNVLAPAILTLVFAAIVLVFGLVITQGIRDIDTNFVNFNITNESNGTAGITGSPSINGSGYILSVEDGEKTGNYAIVEALNGSDNTVISSANYQVNDLGVVTNATAANYREVNFTYTYDKGDAAWDAGDGTVTGLATFADFWEIIVLAIVITVVIGLLLVIFGGKRER